jgi:hypothetical protein
VQTDNLTYASFFNSPENPYRELLSGRAGDVYFWRKAQEYFTLKIHDAVRDAFLETIHLANHFHKSEGRQYIQYGAARRLNMIWYAYRGILDVAPVERNRPLSNEEGREITRDLNVIYINISGAMDNFCLALTHEYVPEKTSLKPQRLGLFERAFIRDNRFKSLRTAIAPHRRWNKDLKTRRHPPAHRFPLYVPPQVVTSSEAAKIQTLWDTHSECMQRLDIDGANHALKKMEQVGNFMPCFAHDPAAGAFPLYPTVPDDLGHLVEIFKAIDLFVKSEKT